MTRQAVTCYVSVGSNIDPAANILAALDALRREHRLTVTGSSTVWQTSAIGRPEQDDYRNGVWQLTTALPARQLQFDVLRGIEDHLGRRRPDDRYAARTIDLDLVLCGHQTSDAADLRLPHPDIERPWVAAGVLEFEPFLSLPDTQRLLASLAPSEPPGVVDTELTAAVQRRIG
ncbi:MAG: 2-amino-4-hydroxy-6-hydroxymethyldihydropteridine diphosphokinase [Planctomycetes bacterium]|jgi:2-amino-4-hydroxy-6-hydroxymethyldihydropteridine diphosphokinase|nr:2-amino-4-hydroxy-6-hydroxymethyldihydropteridine diphosphokinase [Planctomycetota bacterium]